jgi:hypothetical protein
VAQVVAAWSVPQAGVVASKWQLTLLQLSSAGVDVCEKAEVVL